MLIPIRCFTCGTVIAGKWCAYERECVAAVPTQHNHDVGAGAGTNTNNGAVDRRIDPDRGAIMDKLGIVRVCCRRHFLGNVDLMDDM